MANNRTFFKNVRAGRMSFRDIFSDVTKKHTPEENARVLNSMSACYKAGGGWVLRQAHTTPPYRFWLGRCCQTEGGECENIRALPDLQPLDEGKIAEIRTQLNKFINEAVAFGYCPYCGSALRDTLLGPECENCGKSF